MFDYLVPTFVSPCQEDLALLHRPDLARYGLVRCFAADDHLLVPGKICLVGLVVVLFNVSNLVLVPPFVET